MIEGKPQCLHERRQADHMMGRRASITAAVALIGFVGGSLAAPSAVAHQAHRSRCLPHGANTVALDRSVRVYSMPEYVEGVRMQRGIYACLLRNGTTLALEPPPRKRPLRALSHISLAGTMMALVDFQHGVDAGCDVIEVVDVATRRQVLFVPEVGCSVDACLIRCERATDLVVNEYGSVSWIVTRSSFHNSPASIEVHMVSISGASDLLDSSLSIVLGSLQLAPGGDITWFDRGQAMYAKLVGPTHP